MTVEIGKVQKLTSPNPFCLITSKKGDRTTNIMALSWWTYVSNRPATVAICLSAKGLSNHLIRENKEFGLCLPDESIADQAMQCGRCSGRDCDKAAELGIALCDAAAIGAKLVTKSQVAMECKVIQEIPAQDHIMFMAEVVETHIKPEYRHLSSVEGYGKLEVR
ncbi:MAG: flavin reductase family protein [Lachnospiraceae bacterium]|nr:flavin reductase family protein [Lachnospiraceae bacterium]